MNESELFGRIGQALYGEHWQKALAAEIDRNPRTVQRWRAGQNRIPADAWEDVLQLLQQRLTKLTSLSWLARNRMSQSEQSEAEKIG